MPPPALRGLRDSAASASSWLPALPSGEPLWPLCPVKTVNCISDGPGRRHVGDFGGWGLRGVGSRAPSQSAQRDWRLVSSCPLGSLMSEDVDIWLLTTNWEPERRDLMTQWEHICGASPNLKYSPCNSVTSCVTLDGYLGRSHSIEKKLVFLGKGAVPCSLPS